MEILAELRLNKAKHGDLTDAVKFEKKKKSAFSSGRAAYF